MYSRIAGTGSYLPEKILTNADLERLVDSQRRMDPHPHGHFTASCGGRGRDHHGSGRACARARAMDSAGVSAADIDLICVGTTTPDLVFPNVGTLLQDRLGIHGCPAFSMEAACNGIRLCVERCR